jgi:hypothetical protein
MKDNIWELHNLPISWHFTIHRSSLEQRYFQRRHTWKSKSFYKCVIIHVGPMNNRKFKKRLQNDDLYDAMPTMWTLWSDTTGNICAQFLIWIRWSNYKLEYHITKSGWLRKGETVNIAGDELGIVEANLASCHCGLNMYLLQKPIQYQQAAAWKRCREARGHGACWCPSDL